MIHPDKLLAALHDKAEEFSAYHSALHDERRRYHAHLAAFAAASLEEIEAKLAPHDWPGARPTSELGTAEGVCKPFPHQFENHQEARAWAAEKLQDAPTFAVDGSQLMPSKEVSVPVAAVQVGWYYNPHSPADAYIKNTNTTIIGPQELLSSGSAEKLYHDQFISLKRYTLEVETLCQLCYDHTAPGPAVLGFFDGSLLVSFAEVLIELHRNAYLDAACRLLEASRETRTPLFGYIDTTLARDLVRMVSMFLFQDPPNQQDGLLDTDLVNDLLPRWGDRTVAFELARPGILKQYNDAAGGIGFVYLRASSSRPPARVEFPMWVYREGLLDQALDLLRAELIVGSGYPYTLETADQIAWFSPSDRARFLGILQHFLATRTLPLSISPKLQSKRHRR